LFTIYVQVGQALIIMQEAYKVFVGEELHLQANLVKDNELTENRSIIYSYLS